MLTFTFVRLTEVGTYHTPDIPNNLSALSAHSGARMMPKRDFFAAFFTFLATIFSGVVIYTYCRVQASDLRPTPTLLY